MEKRKKELGQPGSGHEGRRAVRQAWRGKGIYLAKKKELLLFRGGE